MTQQYNIFFQLERAFILQFNLNAEIDIEVAANVFDINQPTYAGLPPLPPRYASLILPYDWFLPGKEQRRKRKHRKSHGVISFHDLSAMIVTAWKAVHDEVKAYCSQVCAAGMMRYKTALQEWRKRGAEQAAPRPQVMSMTDYESQMRQPAALASGKHSLKESPLISHVPGMAQDQAQPNLARVLWHEVAAASITKKSFENERIDAHAAVGSNKIARMCETQAPVCLLEPALAPAVANTFLPAIDLQKVKSKQANQQAFRVSMVLNDTDDIHDNDTRENIESTYFLNSYQQETYHQTFRTSTSNLNPYQQEANPMVSSEPVDIDDYEIKDFLNESAPVINPDLQHHSMFGDGGYNKTMQDIHDMKAMLEQQVFAAAMMRYTTAMQEWRERGAEQAAHCLQVMSKKADHESQMRQPAGMNITQPFTNAHTLASGKHSLKKSHLSSHDRHVLGMAQDQAQPNLARVLCQEVAAASIMSKAFENERIDALDDGGSNKIARMCETQAPVCLLEPALSPAVTNTFLPAIDLQNVKSNQAFRVSMVLSDTNDSVDMDDWEIMKLWNEPAPVVNPDLLHHSMFGDGGYDKTMQDIHALNAMLDQKIVQLEQVRRQTFVPPSA